MVSPPPRKLAVLAASTGAVMAIGVVDWQTGVALRVFPLYFLPVAYTAWWLSRRYGVGMALAASVTWLVSNVSAETSDSDPLVWGFNVGAQLVAFVTVGLLVAGLRQRLLAEEELNRVDALTGLPNRRAFRERREWLFSLMRREGRPITVAYVDLDNFKSVNDRHGHQEGDRALRLASEAMRKHLREGDVVARLRAPPSAATPPLELLNMPRDADALAEARRRLVDAGFWVSRTLSPQDLAFEDLLEAAATRAPLV